MATKLDFGTAGASAARIYSAPDILESARIAIDARGQEYNSTNDQQGRERHMQQIVTMFNVATGHKLSARDGWLFMVCLKFVRACSGSSVDTYIDMAAYAALAGEQKDL